MLQIAFVGCAHIHTPGFVKRIQTRQDVQVKAIWDHDRVRAQGWAQELDATQVDNLDAIWTDDQITAVVICAETNRHEHLVLSAAAAGKDMFVEKPLGMGAEDAHRMAKAVEAAGVLFQTGYFMRGNPIHLFLRDQIQRGNFGKITRFRHTNCHAGSLERWFDAGWQWMTDLSQAGIGAFGDLGTHSLDILLWLMGDVVSVTADVDVAVGNYGECDEFGEGLLKFANGAIGSLAAGWVDVAHPAPLILSGTEGHAFVMNSQLFFQSQHVPEADGKRPWTDLPEAWPHAFELFLDAANGAEKVPLVSVGEAAIRSAVMEALYQGAQERRWVTPRLA
jgi:predicted dehydrogenase